ncbi:MAG: hypothetical protein ACM3SQ_17555 [Betaproteobacteria bacterium]
MNRVIDDPRSAIGPARRSRSGRALPLVLLLAAMLAAPVRAEVIDRVLAVVAGDLITLTDVTAARDLGFVRVAPGADPVGTVLSALIDRALVLAEVDRYAPPEPSGDAVDRGVAAVRSRFATQEAFERALERSGIDQGRLRGIVRENLRIEAYEDQRFTVAGPTDEEAAQYYREHAARFTRGGALTPYADVRDEIVAAVTAERRRALVDDWIAGLRRRADIIDLYLTGR